MIASGPSGAVFDVFRAVALFGIPQSLLLSAIILISLWHEPRMWLHDLPKTLQARVSPKTPRERRITWGYSALFLPVFFGVPIIAAVWFKTQHPDATFQTLAGVSGGIVLLFGLIDLVIIDWWVICRWTPSFVVIPGTEGAPEYRDYGYHFRGFLVGVPIMVLVGAVSAAIALNWPG